MAYRPRKLTKDGQGMVIERSNGKPVEDLNYKKLIINNDLNRWVDTGTNILSVINVMHRSADYPPNVAQTLTKRSRRIEQAQ